MTKLGKKGGVLQIACPLRAGVCVDWSVVLVSPAPRGDGGARFSCV